jgi:hypothetical protein
MGHFIASRSDDGLAISFVDTRTGSQRGPDLRLESEVCDVAWASTAEHIVTKTEDGILRKWTNIFESAAVVAQSTERHSYGWLKLSPDDKLIASFGGYASKLWNASDLSLIWEYRGHWSSAGFHPIGHRLDLFCGSSVTSVDLERGIATYHRLNYEAYNTVFDPSGNTFATDTDRSVKILNANTFEEITSLPYSSCKSLQYTPDGNHLVLVLESKKVVVWDVAAGKVFKKVTLDLEFDYIRSAEISKNCLVLLLKDRQTKYTVHLCL